MSNDTDGCERADDSTGTQALAGEFIEDMDGWRLLELKELCCGAYARLFVLASVLYCSSTRDPLIKHNLVLPVMYNSVLSRASHDLLWFMN